MLTGPGAAAYGGVGSDLFQRLRRRSNHARQRSERALRGCRSCGRRDDLDPERVRLSPAFLHDWKAFRGIQKSPVSVVPTNFLECPLKSYPC